MKKFNTRKFVNYATLFSFVILAGTGLILYVTPHGSYSRWTSWTFLLMSKDHLEGIHSIFSFVFILFIIWHLIYHTRTFITYFRNSLSRQKKGRSRELVVSVLLILVVFLGSYFFLPPFNSVIRWGESLKRSWEKDVTPPPIADFESYSLSYIAEQVYTVPVERLIEILGTHSLTGLDPDSTIQEVSDRYHISPKDIYVLLKTELTSSASPSE